MAIDPSRARDKYRRLARGYDRAAALARPARARLVALLELRPGETVVDVACGTGLSFPLIEGAIGEGGRLVGVDLSAEMLEGARARAEAHGWTNVTLIQGDVESVTIPLRADAFLFCLTHDVLQSPRGLANVLGCANPGARVAVFGPKWAPRWAAPINLILRRLVARYTTTQEGLSCPWEHLARLVPDLRVESVALGAFYFARGEVVR